MVTSDFEWMSDGPIRLYRVFYGKDFRNIENFKYCDSTREISFEMNPLLRRTLFSSPFFKCTYQYRFSPITNSPLRTFLKSAILSKPHHAYNHVFRILFFDKN
jgi:hypothetical protein